MATLTVKKVIGTLPGTLTPNTIYVVRVGTGVDFYMTDDTGAVAHKQNTPPITIASSAPGSPATNDIWIDVS